MRKFLAANLCGDYEKEQLNPVYSNTDGDNPSYTEIVKNIGKLSAKTNLSSRTKVFEAIIDEVVEDALKGDVENPVDEESAPTSTGSMRARFIKQLYNRYMNGEISEDEFKEQAGVQENENPAAEAPVADDVTPVVEPSDVEVPEDVPTAMRKSLRYLASSAVNHRNATVLVSRTWSGPMLYEMLDSLKLHLPANFRKKYNIK